MNTGLPYRPPCGGWGRTLFRGGCFQHWRRSASRVKVLPNVTQVANWICQDEVGATVPATVSPYSRRSSPSDNCKDYSLRPGDEGYCEADKPHTKPPCGPWHDHEFKRYACYSEAAVAGETIDLNCYGLLSDKLYSVALCQKRGFKNAQAAVWWHGQPPFTSDEECYNAFPAAFSKPSESNQSRYLCLTWSARYFEHVKVGPPPNEYADYTMAAAVTLTVDRLTGFVTATDNSYTYDGPVGTEAETGALTQLAFMFGLGKMTAGAAYMYGVKGGPGEQPPNANYPDGYNYDDPDNQEWKRFSCSATTLHYEAYKGYGGFGHSTWDCSASLSDAYTATELSAVGESLLSRIDLVDDVRYPWRMDQFVSVAPLVMYDGFPAVRYPWDADWMGMFQPGWQDPAMNLYTGEIRGDLIGGGYPMCRESGESVDQYLCGEGTSIENGSILQLRCVPYNLVESIEWVDSYWYDEAEQQWTLFCHDDAGTYWTTTDTESDPPNTTLLLPLGRVKIKAGTGGETFPDFPGLNITSPQTNPLTCNIPAQAESIPDDADVMIVVGYARAINVGGHFERKHITTRMMFDTEAEPPHWVVDELYYGAYSGGSSALDDTDAPIPHNATQWTETNTSHTGLSAVNLFPGAWVYMAPGSGLLAMQKYAEVKLPWHIQNWFGPCGAQRDYLSNGDPCTATNQTDCEAGTPASPTYTFPNAKAIEGDRAATCSEPDAGVVTMTLGEAADYLRVGDKVEFTDDDGVETDDNGGSGYTISTVTSATEFEFSAAAKPTGTRVKSLGAPPFWYYDTDGKGYFLVAKWSFNYRTASSRGTQTGLDADVCGYTLTPACLSFSPCYPAVVCISPNTGTGQEDFDHVYQAGWGTQGTGGDVGFVVDFTDGTRWQALVRQVERDIFYQAPNAPCVWDEVLESCAATGCSWKEDLEESETPCQADTEGCPQSGIGSMFYPYHRIVEPSLRGGDPWDGEKAPEAWKEGDTFDVGAYLTNEFEDNLTSTALRYASYDQCADGEDLTGYEVIQPPDAVGGCGTGDEYENGSAGAERCIPNVPDLEWTPWVLFAWMQECVCAAGQFAEDYEAILGCWMCGSEPSPEVDPGLGVPDAGEAPPEMAGGSTAGEPTTEDDG